MTVKVYVAAIAELYNTQLSLGIAHGPKFRGQSLKALMTDLARKQAQKRKAAFEDRGAKGLNASYTMEQFLHL
jgi:hypothetical protein